MLVLGHVPVLENDTYLPPISGDAHLHPRPQTELHIHLDVAQTPRVLGVVEVVDEDDVGTGDTRLATLGKAGLRVVVADDPSEFFHPGLVRRHTLRRIQGIPRGQLILEVEGPQVDDEGRLCRGR